MKGTTTMDIRSIVMAVLWLAVFGLVVMFGLRFAGIAGSKAAAAL